MHYKKIIPSIFAPLIFSTFFVGCASKPYLQRAEISGLAPHHPIHVVDEKKTNDLIISTQLAYNDQSKLKYNTGTHSKVNNEGIFVPDTSGDVWFYKDDYTNNYEYRGKNLTWDIPKFEILTNLEYTFSKHFSLLVGGSYGSMNKNNYWAMRLGIDVFWEFRLWALNFDSNIAIQSLNYEIECILRDDYRGWFVNSKGTETNFDPSIFITLNSKVSEWPFNVFYRTGGGILKLLDVDLNVDNVDINFDNILYATDYWVFTIGLFKKVSSRLRFDIGLNLYRYSNNNLYRNSDKNDPDYIFDTFIQYEFSLK